MNKFFQHMKTVLVHKHYVFIGCCKLGIPRQGLVHDLSKFSPIEISTSRYWNGTSSPITEEKALKGYSLGWTHHKNCNKHHWEYWMDFKERQPICVPMPPKYLLESFADWYGASRAYNGGKFYIDKFQDFVRKEFENKKMFYPQTGEVVRKIIYTVEDERDYFYFVKKYVAEYKKWYKAEVNG